MRVCADCFKAEDWIEKFKVISEKGMSQCSFCGLQKETVDVEMFLPYLQELLSLFEKKDDGRSLCKIIEDDFDVFSSSKQTVEIIKYALAKGKFNFSIDDLVEYKSNILRALKIWDELKNKIKNQFRFFASFDPQEDGEWDTYFEPRENGAVIRKGEVFYRGRLNYDSEKLLKRKRDLGMPPSEKTPAGRVNPHGIPCLYLTKLEETVAYELRATYGDKVSIGKFIVQNDLRVIDFDNKFILTESVDSGNIEEKVKAFLFKKQVGIDLSRPMRRYDNKEIEYIPTQFVCEYIKTMGADGIMFNSAVHQGGKNLVLFSSNKVKCTKVDVKTVGKITMLYQ